jgi:hypothetical protein
VAKCHIEREQGRRILGRHGSPGEFVHGRGAGEQRVDVESLQRGREQAYGAEFGRAPTDPVPHRKPGQPAFLDGGLFQFRALARHGDKVLRMIEPGGAEGGGCFEHPIPRFDGASGLRDHHHQGLREFLAELGQHVVHAVRVGVVEEGDPHPVGRRLSQRVTHELGPQGRSTNAHDQDLGEAAARSGDRAGMHLGRKRLHGGDGRRDRITQGGGRREAGGAQPVMAHHPVLIRIGDGAALERLHRGECLLHRRLHARDEIIRPRQTAQIERATNFRIRMVMGFEVRPHEQ